MYSFTAWRTRLVEELKDSLKEKDETSTFGAGVLVVFGKE